MRYPRCDPQVVQEAPDADSAASADEARARAGGVGSAKDGEGRGGPKRMRM